MRPRATSIPLSLGNHAATGDAAAGTTGHGLIGAIVGAALGNQGGGRILARVGGVQPLLVGKDALRVSFANLSIEDMLRLWGRLGVPYRLSVLCVVRTARLTARERMESSTANSNELVMSPMAP
jgi:hypothetical protein